MEKSRPRRNEPRHIDVAKFEAELRRASPPTDDDVTILNDGTRLDTREKTLAWIEEILALRLGDQAQ